MTVLPLRVAVGLTVAMDVNTQLVLRDIVSSK